MSTEKTNQLQDHSHSARMAKFESASTALTLLSDQQMEAWLAQSTTAYSGIGGTAVSLEINGVKFFAKKVAITDTEMLPENLMSTRNIFHLPPSFHYGIMSLGFGAWRELACHTMTTNWVLSQKCENFPLMYHWRILKNQKRRQPNAAVQAELSTVLTYWNNLDSVSSRLKELENSTTNLILFLEHIPHNLLDWLNHNRESTEDAVSAACSMIERNLRKETPFMSENEFFHLDAHSKNILTDGERLYFTDFGLSMSNRFDLSPDERAFAENNSLYDLSHTISQFTNWLVTAYGGEAAIDIASRNRFITESARGSTGKLSSDCAAVIVKRYAPIAVIFNEFYAKLFQGFTETPFPAEQLRQTWSKCGLKT